MGWVLSTCDQEYRYERDRHGPAFFEYIYSIGGDGETYIQVKSFQSRWESTGQTEERSSFPSATQPFGGRARAGCGRLHGGSRDRASLGGWRGEGRTPRQEQHEQRPEEQGLRSSGGQGHWTPSLLFLFCLPPGARHATPCFPESLAFSQAPVLSLGGRVRAGPGLEDLGSFGDSGLLPGLVKVLVSFTPLLWPGPAHLILPFCSHRPFWPILCPVHLHLPLA